ncbi:uncharacterized protein LOC111617303 [Centruroides sculpturatus]|uniref:uncharacterized protein LOC111617303 n=1 Tax=Centruroides sculpturatus TaxID=218467 RepID=UPI000C6CDD37|nr:uncharacterized protein LOC111617303 [Centruroides sculpturatus]XP_023214381.1 uncharacterized protein LOC111617303 [Centruroides sculpturatus]
MYFLLIVFTTVYLCFYYRTNATFYKRSIRIYKNYVEAPEPGFLVYSEECQIPDFDPYDETVKRFVKVQETLDCSKKYPSFTFTRRNQLFLNTSHEIFQENDIDCCYRPFYRPYEAKRDNEIRYDKTCVNFTSETTVNDEFVSVECWKNNTIIHKIFHSFIHDKPRVEARAMRINQLLKKKDLYSVMIIGVDSVSRLNMHRQLPKTLEYLKTNMDAIEMYGYNKVGDNTFPNLIPLLSGYHEKEIAFCRKSDKVVIDKCPLLWKRFEEFGYRTFYAEDTPHMSTFNYVKPGFSKQPTDYYFRPFILEAEDNQGWKYEGFTYQCIGPTSETEAVLSWLESFAKNFNTRSYFAFGWINSLTHHFLNYGSYGDSYYADFFRRLHESGDLKNTVVILMSDHGMRWGPIRSTYIGRLEERLPAVLISFPPTFREKHPDLMKNVQINAHRLTTPFDLFATLNNLLDIQESTLQMDYWTVPHDIASNYIRRARSIFQVIPKNRSCSDASIDEHWCTCQQSKSVSVTNEEVVHVADYLLEILNSKLRNYVKCATLATKDIVDARMQAPSKHLAATEEYNIFDYSVTLRTIPGNGLFEGTVRFVPKNHTHALLGDISRLNLYVFINHKDMSHTKIDNMPNIISFKAQFYLQLIVNEKAIRFKCIFLYNVFHDKNAISSYQVNAEET